ncbi:MAG TPA: tRNA pseudouridine(55) synthase TruB [Candidatus Saccharibacteria bacterium]|nr:tRNA pseudouridine(55) synthase TruB [Candidatus Saccharibacteria bacterium]MCB9817729.1 tRNA pseudouridine(55) synthase TruB [Candidatus Nomurabacteria bacterium]HPD98636.1 tRNA pseudouridine(55) synthase TruB [Candidatus Saccharibacteria bacterium]HPR09990.1 tRNA pseudouridine(55) synthase TruB [Candidatus Saccharibacteria bacterium]
MIEGLLLIDKPAGISSFGVVAKVRGIVRAKTGIKKIKVGHTGTLDPAATGLLILAVGSYTKKVPLLMKQDKTYFVTMKLGQTSSTGDKEGEISAGNAYVPTQQEVHDVITFFTGSMMQTPPVFSALKLNGRRAYDLARQGKEFTMQPRPVMVHSSELNSYTYPFVTFTTHVGSGTYIRSLVEDIGNKLGTGAYMSDLRRTKIGSYMLEEAVPLGELNTETIQSYLQIDLK